MTAAVNLHAVQWGSSLVFKGPIRHICLKDGLKFNHEKCNVDGLGHLGSPAASIHLVDGSVVN